MECQAGRTEGAGPCLEEKQVNEFALGTRHPGQLELRGRRWVGDVLKHCDVIGNKLLCSFQSRLCWKQGRRLLGDRGLADRVAEHTQHDPARLVLLDHVIERVCDQAGPRVEHRVTADSAAKKVHDSRWLQGQLSLRLHRPERSVPQPFVSFGPNPKKRAGRDRTTVIQGESDLVIERKHLPWHCERWAGYTYHTGPAPASHRPSCSHRRKYAPVTDLCNNNGG